MVPAPLQATNTPEGYGEIECCSGTPSSVAVFIDNPIVSQRFVLNRLQQFTILNLCGEGSDVLVRQAHHKSIALDHEVDRFAITSWPCSDEKHLLHGSK